MEEENIDAAEGLEPFGVSDDLFDTELREQRVIRGLDGGVCLRNYGPIDEKESAYEIAFCKNTKVEIVARMLCEECFDISEASSSHILKITEIYYPQDVGVKILFYVSGESWRPSSDGGGEDERAISPPPSASLRSTRFLPLDQPSYMFDGKLYKKWTLPSPIIIDDLEKARVWLCVSKKVVLLMNCEIGE